MSVNTGLVDLTLEEAQERINCHPPATPDLLVKPATELPQMKELTKYSTGFAQKRWSE